jgi:hypothetical protein
MMIQIFIILCIVIGRPGHILCCRSDVVKSLQNKLVINQNQPSPFDQAQHSLRSVFGSRAPVIPLFKKIEKLYSYISKKYGNKFEHS